MGIFGPKVEIKWLLPKDAARMAGEMATSFGCDRLGPPLGRLLAKVPLSDIIKGVVVVRSNQAGRRRLSLYIMTEFARVSSDHTPTDLLRDDYNRLLQEVGGAVSIEISFANVRNDDPKRVAARVARGRRVGRVEVALTERS